MKKIVLMLLSMVLVAPLLAQIDYKRQYELLSKGSSDEVLAGVVRDWERAAPNDVDMLVAAFNINLKQSFRNVVQFSDQKPDGIESIEFTDSVGVKTYLFEVTVCDSAAMATTQNYIDRAIELRPDRMDFRLGKITSLMYGGVDLRDQFVEQVERVIDDYKSTEWLWDKDEKGVVDDKFFEECVQDYCNQLFELADDESYQMVDRIATRMTALFPKSAAFHSDRGAVAFFNKDYAAAEQHYRQASKLAPDDLIIMRNCAVTYNKLGETKKATSYLNKMIKKGGDEDRAFAEKLLERLGK